MFSPFLALLAVLGTGVSSQDAKDKDSYQTIPLKTHSISEPYLDSDMQSRWWEFGGSTVIRTDQYVRLTADRPSQDGWLFSRVPLTVTNWEIELEFSISGKGHLYGDGFAMWLTKQRAQAGKVFGAPDKFEGLGIFFDTYKNNRPGVTFPYVMAMMGDGNTEYDKDNDGKANEIGGCSARGIRNAQVTTKARLTYFQDQNLVLALQYKNDDEWTECFNIPNLKIPSVAYLGFSAETGELSDNHDIISIETKNLYDASARRKQGSARSYKAQQAARKANKSGGWGWFLLKIVLFCAACGGGYIGFTVYRTNKRSRF